MCADFFSGNCLVLKGWLTRGIGSGMFLPWFQAFGQGRLSRKVQAVDRVLLELRRVHSGMEAT